MSFSVPRPLGTTGSAFLPEPWQESDGLNLNAALPFSWRDKFGVGKPHFLLDYANGPSVIPDALQSNHVRSSVATRWDSNGDLVEDSAGTLRLQRDPKTQDMLGLLYEPKRAQLLNHPTSPSSMSTAGISSINSNAGQAKGQDYHEIVEDNSTGQHQLTVDNIGGSVSKGDPLALSAIVKNDGRDWFLLQYNLTDGTDFSRPQAWFDLNKQNLGSTDQLTDATLIDHQIDDLGGGWSRVRFTINPDSNWRGGVPQLKLANADGAFTYTGDGSSGIRFIHAQCEVSREVTTPILSGGAVREADEVDYRFSSPDKTTGVAYSIEQQSGGGNIFDGSGGLRFGTTSDARDHNHGVIMFTGAGVNADGDDGYKTVTRNTDDDTPNGVSPLDETIDRFKVLDYLNAQVAPSLIVRQIAIHTQPHTATQLSDLESNYLTQP